MLSFFSRLVSLLGPVDGAVKGIVNTAELRRVVGASLTSGLVSLAIGVLLAVQGDLSAILAPGVLSIPVVGSAITTGLAAAIDYFRRKQHGADVPA